MTFIPFIIVFTILLLAFLFVPKNKKTKKIAVLFLTIALLGEIFVANFHSFHLIFGNYDKTAVNLESDNVIINGATENGANWISNGQNSTVTVEIIDIEQAVGTIYIECELPYDSNNNSPASYINVAIDAKDSTSSASYRNYLADGQIIRENDRSAVIVLDLSGEVNSLRIKLIADSGSDFTLKNIVLNRTVPFNFSVLRLLIIVLCLFGVYALLKFPRLLSSFDEEKRLCRIICFALTAVMITAAFAINYTCQYNNNQGFVTDFKSTSGNQISEELVDAFEAGQVSLLDEPPQNLLDMENPYDWSARSAGGVSCKWDHLLFEGKYYSYYGIAPVLLLFMPYHMITDYYFPTPEAVLLFGSLGILFLTLAFLEFIKLFGKKIPLNIIITSLIILQFSSGIWYCFASPLFYEIAQSSGFLFTCAGFYFLLRSGVIGEGKLKYSSIALSTFCLATAVLCRPTLALYCITSLLFLGYGFIKQKNILKDDDKKHKIKQYSAFFASALIPFIVIASIQVLYNFARFGSFFDFGIQYSLTINDFTKSQYNTDFVMIGLYNFLIAFPIIKPEFPYIFSNFSKLSVNGYYFAANYNAVGLFFRSLPMFGYFGTAKALRIMDKKQRLKFLLLVLPSCVIAPLIIIFSIWESGYGVRYCADFAWQMILGGCAVFYYLYINHYKAERQRLLQKFFVVAAVVAIFINFAMIYDYLPKNGFLESHFLSFKRLFDFWL